MTWQARDAGVEVGQLEGPRYGDYKRIKKLPSGSTLVRLDTNSKSGEAGQLVSYALSHASRLCVCSCLCMWAFKVVLARIR